MHGQRLARQARTQRGNQRLQHERRLARPAHARDGRQGADGYVHAQGPHRVYLRSLQVKRAATVVICAPTRLPRDTLNPTDPSHVRADAGRGGVGGLVDGALEDDATAVRARAWADLDQVIRGCEDTCVMVDDDSGIPVGEEFPDDRQDAVDVGGV